jgi:hypothetical protein
MLSYSEKVRIWGLLGARSWLAFQFFDELTDKKKKKNFDELLVKVLNVISFAFQK